MRMLIPFKFGRGFLGLAKARDVITLQEQVQELQSELSDLKDYLNVDGEKKLVAKKTVADTVLETMKEIAPMLSGIVPPTDKKKK